MFDSPQTDEVVGVVPELGGFALQDLDLKAEPVVEVDVEGGENPSVVCVTGTDEAVREFPLLVVIEQGEGRHHLTLLIFDLVLDQPATDQIADGFRSVPEAPAVEQLFEAFEQLSLDGNGDSLQRHTTSKHE